MKNYHTTYDALYNKNDEQKMLVMLVSSGFGSLYQLFQCKNSLVSKLQHFLKLISHCIIFLDENIDFQALMALTDVHIENLLKQYPLGVRAKFWKALKKFQEENNEENITEGNQSVLENDSQEVSLK